MPRRSTRHGVHCMNSSIFLILFAATTSLPESIRSSQRRSSSTPLRILTRTRSASRSIQKHATREALSRAVAQSASSSSEAQNGDSNGVNGDGKSSDADNDDLSSLSSSDSCVEIPTSKWTFENGLNTIY